LVLACLCYYPAQAQLAITEVMAEGATNNYPYKGPDFFELTNFGTNDLALDGYSFNDSRRTYGTVRAPFTDLVIQAGESVVFFRVRPYNIATNAETFRAWWGESNCPPAVQVRTYQDPGFDGEAGDEVWVYDSEMNVVDSVKFSVSKGGHTFTYDPDTGVFGVVSTLGMNGVFKAEQADDYGSPGNCVGLTPLRIVRQPADQSADAGGKVTLSILAVGMPRPKYQWFQSGVPIPGATASSLTYSNVQPQQGGVYTVKVSNGLTDLASLPATLTISTRPRFPEILAAPADLTVFTKQTAVFAVEARGYPQLRYQWYANEGLIADATNSTLEIPDVTKDLSGTSYTVVVANELGATNATARLTVTRRPMLLFTEVQPYPNHGDSSGHYNWFELSNADTNAVNLQGYRFFDTPWLEPAFTITNELIIQPGESIVFVEMMSPEQFMNWWGADNLPTDLDIYMYHGFALGITGEQLFLWNAAATDPYDYLSMITWPSANPGYSMECVNDCTYLEDYGCMGECATDSSVGQNGAFRSADNTDIGSPAYTANPPPRIISIRRAGLYSRLYCRGVEGKTYQLMFLPEFSGGAWQPLQSQVAPSSLFEISDATAGTSPVRFYRLQQKP
jgi:hypothetical protein